MSSLRQVLMGVARPASNELGILPAPIPTQLLATVAIRADQFEVYIGYPVPATPLALSGDSKGPPGFSFESLRRGRWLSGTVGMTSMLCWMQYLSCNVHQLTNRAKIVTFNS